MKKRYDLSQLNWHVAGFTPYMEQLQRSMETDTTMGPEILPVPAHVPGSVQQALLDAKIIPDWNVGLNTRQCEWVENRHWVYETYLIDEWIDKNSRFYLYCQGLDYCGSIVVNNRSAGTFKNTFISYRFDLTPYLRERNNILQIVFECPPRWLGQIGFTSMIREWKERFNYTWDWTSRLVQIGIWDEIFLEKTDGKCIERFGCTTDLDPESKKGILNVKAGINAESGAVAKILMFSPQGVIKEEKFSLNGTSNHFEFSWADLPIELWWPNNMGEQVLYSLKCDLYDLQGNIQDSITKRIGFKRVEWEDCEGAPEGATPWICVVNGKRVFLQGVNWIPIRPNFADVKRDDYYKRLKLYKDIGCNILRVWGGGVLEKQWFYEFCDELGLLVWQEFPLSSSGIDNWPPEDPGTIQEIVSIADSYIERRQHHVSLTIWCGGNELQGNLEGEKTGCGKPVGDAHPLIKALKDLVKTKDPGRRFLPTSSSGPRFTASKEDFGKGLHWDVHGPWQLKGDFAEWEDYWRRDDALFRSEAGSGGANDVDIIQETKGSCSEFPISCSENPLWRRFPWWLERDAFVEESGREPKDLDEYVIWSQTRQAKALKTIVESCKNRFPRCGGVLLWMGHDCFPCPVSPSIVNYYGNPKPAAKVVGKIFNKKIHILR